MPFPHQHRDCFLDFNCSCFANFWRHDHERSTLRGSLGRLGLAAQKRGTDHSLGKRFFELAAVISPAIPNDDGSRGGSFRKININTAQQLELCRRLEQQAGGREIVNCDGVTADLKA